MMKTLTRRLFRQKWLLTTVLIGLGYFLLVQYQQINQYQEKYTDRKKSYSFLKEKPAVVDIRRFNLQENITFNESLLEKIRASLEKPKNYDRVDQKPKNSSVSAPNGIAEKVDALLGHKTGGIYIEIGVGNDNEDGLIHWLESVLDWSGLILEPNINVYNLGMSGRSNARVLRSCLEVNKKPWYHSSNPVTQRDCFPIAAVMKAAFSNESREPDLLAINSNGKELEILGSFPFNTCRVKVVLMSLGGAIADTTDIHKLMNTKGFKGRLISNNHSLGRTYIVMERRTTDAQR